MRYRAVVDQIKMGPHGRYAKCRSEDLQGPVTFNIDDPEVWSEKASPEKGSGVFLWDIREKNGRWRAYKACFIRPELSSEK